ncbi:MAG: DUF2029 domain-containing protein [Gemmatimonadetes bacterium]|nr:DUF2029 domain-containing protein [Gemmatimonadota bacterium]
MSRRGGQRAPGVKEPFRLPHRLLDATTLLAAFLLVEAVGRAWSYGRAMPGVDYYQYWVAGQALVEFPELDLYVEADRRVLAGVYAGRAARPGASREHRLAAAYRSDRLALSGTPFLYSLFAPLFSGERNYNADFARFRALSMLCAGVSLLWLARMCRVSGLTTLLILASYYLWYAPFYSELTVGNVNQIQLGCVALALGLLHGAGSARRRLAAGAVIGATVMLKPNIVVGALLLGVFWLASRRYRTAAQVASGVLFGAALAATYAGIRSGGMGIWWAWRHALRYVVTEIDYSLGGGNMALSRVLSELAAVQAGPVLGLGLVGLISAGVVLAGARIAAAPGAPRDVGIPEVLVFFSGINAGLLASRIVWLHYFVLLYPLVILILCARRAGSGEDYFPWPWRLGALVTLAGLGIPPGPPFRYAATSAVGMLLLYGLSVAWLMRTGRGRTVDG